MLPQVSHACTINNIKAIPSLQLIMFALHYSDNIVWIQYFNRQCGPLVTSSSFYSLTYMEMRVWFPLLCKV